MTVLGSRHDFGNNWAEVVNAWCLGQALDIPDEAAWEALGILERFWPEYLGDELNRGRSIRGYPIMLGIIDVGLDLAACQGLRGFEGIVKRLRSGDKDVLTEVQFAAFLVGLGYNPVLDEEHHGKKPDALIVLEGQEIFIDVISPHLSDEMTTAYAAMKKLAEVLLEKLAQRASNTRLDVHCLNSPNEILDTVSRFLDNTAQPDLEAVYELAGNALIKFSSRVDHPESASVIPPDTLSPTLGVSVANHTSNNVCVSYSVADERLKRKISDKLKQFSPEEINLLAIDVTHIPNGFKGWQPPLQRYLTPERNRRFSGVMLYQRLWNGTGRSLRQWHLEQHPNPYKNLPPSFIEALQTPQTNQTIC